MVSRRGLLKFAASSAAGLMAMPMGPARPKAATDVASPALARGRSIKVGLLWSLSGHLSVIEKPSRDVALFWIDETNRNGGVAGVKIEPVSIDTNSDMKAYRAGILKLMREEQVLATFGGYTSASRRAIMPLVTANKGLF